MNRSLLFGVLFIHAALLAQQTDDVDFKRAKAHISFNIEARIVKGTVNYTFHVLKPTDSIFIDARNMTFLAVKLNGKKAKYGQNKSGLWIKKRFSVSENNTIKIDYTAKPKKALYFIDWDANAIDSGQIWTQGQGKYTSNWLPSFDAMDEKVEFDLSITFHKDYQVIANGKLLNKTTHKDQITWHYDMQKPMSSYLVALAIGKFSKRTQHSKTGIPLEQFYLSKDVEKVEPTYRYSKLIFDFLEEEIGVPYPWQNYKQIPVKDFLYAGMENTGTTIFADSFVIDATAFKDKNYVNVNAHELAHQWFGNLVTETSGTHHWLQEGFATYYALLAERAVFGEDYYYLQLYAYYQELLDQDKAGGSTALLNPKSSSTTFYKKGAWVLHVLREKIGDLAFKAGVTNYLNKHQFKNVNTSDFISEVEQTSTLDLSVFVEKWLKSADIDFKAMTSSLKQHSKDIKTILELDCKAHAASCLEKLNSDTTDAIKIEIIRKNPSLINKTHFKNSLKVRQAIAKNVMPIPLHLKKEFESLLEDPSYLTKENALFNLWKSFPEARSKYLDATKGIQGFPDKNIRILWLALALITDDYRTTNQTIYLKELVNYTSSQYGYEIRLNAFQYLESINACQAKCLDHLQEATKHHNWQFSKFAKNLLHLK